MLVTVVVPVYKTEKYLDRCISSIVNQTHRDLEIILVDDGSPDSCPQLCDRWSQRDERIRVIHKENAGQGMARNTGIDSASGDYICFVDSDDFILPETIETALAAAQQENADLTMYGFIMVGKDGKRNPIVPVPEQTIYRDEAVLQEFLPDYIGADPKTGRESSLPGGACTCLISMDLVRRTNWRFVSEREIICEDGYSIMALCRDVKTVIVLNQALYCYFMNEVSFSHSYIPNRFERCRFCYEKNVELCRENGYPEETIRRCANQFIGGTIASLKLDAMHFTDRQSRLARLRQVIDDALLQKVLWETRAYRRNLKKQLFCRAMRNKQYRLCDILLRIKNTSGL